MSAIRSVSNQYVAILFAGLLLATATCDGGGDGDGDGQKTSPNGTGGQTATHLPVCVCCGCDSGGSLSLSYGSCPSGHQCVAGMSSNGTEGRCHPQTSSGYPDSNYDCKGSCKLPQCPQCQPICSEKQCGGDGCGGTCGDCAQGEVCNSGQCEDGDSCTSTCSANGCACGFVCGDACGTCPGGYSCNDGCHCQCMSAQRQLHLCTVLPHRPMLPTADSRIAPTPA